MKIKYILPVLLAGLLGCAPNINVPQPSSGSASFYQYVSLGDGYAAGYMDNALYRGGQQNSYAVFLSQQFKLAGGGAFVQPLLPESSGDVGIGTPIVTGGNNSRYVMRKQPDCTGEMSLEPVLLAAVGDTAALSNRVTGKFNDLSVALGRSYHLTDNKLAQTLNIPNFNPYFARYATNPNVSPLDMAEAMDPTFYTLWAGMGDYMLYAAKGGRIDAKANLGGFELTLTDIYKLSDPAAVENSLKTVVERLKAKGAKGVIGNLPDISTMPHFNTIPYDTLVLTQAGVDSLAPKYAGNANVSLKVGRNAVIIRDNKGNVRQAKPDEKIVLLGLPEIKCNKRGYSTPLPHEFILETDELAAIAAAVTAYNASIKKIAQDNGVPMADMNYLFKRLQFGGFSVDGIPMNSTFVTGGFFSLDGFTPSARGQAVIANEFIRVINDFYEAKIPYVDVTAVSGVPFP